MQITPKGLIQPDLTQINQWKHEFAERSCIVVPGLFEENLLQKILHKLETASFFENEHQAGETIFATDLTVQSNTMALHQVNLLLNNTGLFRLMEEITGHHHNQVQGFTGRIYRNMPGAGHKLDWHDDTEDSSRLIGVSMNLSAEKYTGGAFQLREKKTRTMLREVSGTSAGDTHIFRVSPLLQHCVTETTGTIPRTAAAGWFINKPAPSLF